MQGKYCVFLVIKKVWGINLLREMRILFKRELLVMKDKLNVCRKLKRGKEKILPSVIKLAKTINIVRMLKVRFSINSILI